MSDYHINIFHGDEDGGYIADIPGLDSCSVRRLKKRLPRSKSRGMFG